MKSIVLVVPYLRKWPFWFEAYLVSIAKNPSIHWLFITDCKIPKEYPKNITFIAATLEELNLRINTALNVEVPLSPRKLCDIRPAYGKVFQEYISNYDFWGFCDADIIWGDIRKFITNDMLSDFDLISSRKANISGHFTIFRNIDSINNYYKTIPQYNYLLEQPKYMWSEEQVLTKHLIAQSGTKNTPMVFWSDILCNQEKGIDSHQEYHLDKWLWKDGKMIDQKTNNEVMYLHFINWKRTMTFSEIKYSEKITQFYISYSGLHFEAHSKKAHLLNFIKNIFNGYWVRMRRKKMKLYKKLFK